MSLKDIDVVDNIRGLWNDGVVLILKCIKNLAQQDLHVSNTVYDAGVNFKATGDCLIIAPMFICEKKTY